MTVGLGHHASMSALLLRAFSRMEALDADERALLDGHLAYCTECASRFTLMEAARAELRSQSFRVDPAVVSATQARVRRCGRQLRAQEEFSKPIWIACGVAFAWAAASSPFLWEGFSWLGQIHDLPDAMWQTGFYLAWLMPAAVLSTIGIALDQRQKAMSK